MHGSTEFAALGGTKTRKGVFFISFGFQIGSHLHYSPLGVGGPLLAFRELPHLVVQLHHCRHRKIQTVRVRRRL